jgi:hypothetical protein
MPSRIHVDHETFDPWRVQAVTHALSDHPLLQIDAVVELGKRQEQRGLIRTHSDRATAGTSFGEAPRLHPNALGAEATLSRIAEARAWMSLLNVQADPIYRRLIDEVLEDVRPVVERKDPGMCYRAGWIFVSSPNAVTPFHMDHEHNFILQIRGSKHVHTWDPFDREVVSERGQELFHAEHSREGVVWRDELMSRARVFHIEAGMGAYMPSTTPHMVKNGPDISITVSFTYYTRSTRRRELLYRGNHRLRALGLSPRPVGATPAYDGVKHAVLATFLGAKRALDRARGRDIKSTAVPYALVP